MEASVVDLRYKMNDILKALDRNEKVTILYHGKVKGVIMPAAKKERGKIKDHPFFGMSKNDERSVLKIMQELRGTRYHAV